jgi:hypothetical protein
VASFKFCARYFIFVKTTKLAMKRTLEVMPNNMHVPGLFTGSNWLVVDLFTLSINA